MYIYVIPSNKMSYYSKYNKNNKKLCFKQKLSARVFLSFIDCLQTSWQHQLIKVQRGSTVKTAVKHKSFTFNLAPG